MNVRKRVSMLVKTTAAVAVLSLLAFFTVPRVSHGSDARLDILKEDLKVIRAQLELYKKDHNGEYPTNIVEGLTKKTDSDGRINESGRFGPYMREFPWNPFVGDKVRGAGTAGTDGEGWYYHPASGVIRPNTRGHENL